MHNTPTLLNTPPRRNQLDVLEDIAGGIDALVEAGPGGGGGVDRELAVVQYRVKTAFTGASVGDTVTSIRVIDVTNAPAQVGATLWYNETTAQTLASAPAAANLEPSGASGITNAQMAALLTGMATAALQTTGNTSLGSIDTKVTGLATQATLAAVLAKLSADPATQTTLAALLAKTISNPATDTLQTAGNTAITTMSAKLPASLGAKTGALSLSMVPGTDALFQLAARYNTTLPTFTNGQSAELQTDPRGGLYVTVASGGTVALITDNSADARAATSIGLTTRSFNYVYNGGTWDRAFGDATGQSVNQLKRPLVARQLAVTTASAAVALTGAVKRVSILARGADMRYVVLNATGSAVNTTSHFIAAGERLDLDVGSVGATPFIAAIIDSLSTILTGQLEISELS